MLFQDSFFYSLLLPNAVYNFELRCLFCHKDIILTEVFVPLLTFWKLSNFKIFPKKIYDEDTERALLCGVSRKKKMTESAYAEILPLTLGSLTWIPNEKLSDWEIPRDAIGWLY